MEQFLQVAEGGERRLLGHPGWLIGDTAETGRLLTAAELVEHGFGLMVVGDPPPFDPVTQICTLLPISDWTIGGATATRTYAVADLSVEDVRTAKFAALAEKRWGVTTGGVTLPGGVIIRTDPDSRSNITGGVSLFENDPTLEFIDWEAQPGEWVTIDKATMIAIGIAAGRHVQACFSRARTLSALIASAEDVAAIVAIDLEGGWPT